MELTIERVTSGTCDTSAWANITLGDCISLRRGHDLTWRDRRSGDIPVMGSAGLAGYHDTALARGPGVVLGRSGASFGQAHYCESDFWPHNTALYVTDFRRNDPRFVFYLLSAIDFSRHNSGGAQQSLNRNFIAPIAVALPQPSEQRLIAQALDDVDALLGALDRLIAKKLDFKQAAMQELLTGQTRLPGFSGEWEVKRLGRLGDFLKGSGIRRDEALSGELPCVRYGELYTIHNDIVRSFASRISHAVAATARRIGRGDVLFAGSGETKEEIGKSVAIVQDVEAFAGGDIVILRLHGGDPTFFGYLTNMPQVARQKANRGQGDAVVHISAAALASVEVAVPQEVEQHAISRVLSDMDAELEALEQRRAKTAALKQGMMQELITGRTRLL
ncbi:restriction endonuclease subunit S [Muricoccus vinaceus]|uniref:Restriction endonuclease subunit S n=1 Tax=Muricoccus vinaceus TaxID=424704 RepID=A0ABV6ITC6_9PROT